MEAHEQMLQARKADLAAILATPAGRRYLAWLVATANTFAQSYVPDDTHGTAFNEGMRSVGRLVTRDARLVGMKEFTKLMEEKIYA